MLAREKTHGGEVTFAAQTPSPGFLLLQPSQLVPKLCLFQYQPLPHLLSVAAAAWPSFSHSIPLVSPLPTGLLCTASAQALPLNLRIFLHPSIAQYLTMRLLPHDLCWSKTHAGMLTCIS